MNKMEDWGRVLTLGHMRRCEVLRAEGLIILLQMVLITLKFIATVTRRANVDTRSGVC